MPQPRLLLATPDFPPGRGGIQLLLARLCDELEGWEVEVVTRRAPSGSPPLADTVAVQRTRRRTGAASLLELNALTLRAAAARRPDLVLCGHVTAAPAAALLGLRVPLVSYVYADEVPAHPQLARLALSRSRRVVAISRHAEQIARRAGAREDAIRLIPPGVDLPAVVPEATREPTLITVARLTDRYKGHDVVLRALLAVLARFPDARWVVVGDGPLRPELERTAAELGVRDHVVFSGAVDDDERDRLLGEAQVFVMPSRLPSGGEGGEGFGIVYLEAGARGVPSVAGNVGGAPDAVVHEETGLLVDPESPDAVAGALIALLADPARVERLGLAARARAERFAWPEIVAQVDAVLREALDA